MNDGCYSLFNDEIIEHWRVLVSLKNSLCFHDTGMEILPCATCACYTMHINPDTTDRLYRRGIVEVSAMLMHGSLGSNRYLLVCCATWS